MSINSPFPQFFFSLFPLNTPYSQQPQNSYKSIVFLWAILCSVKLLGWASYCLFFLLFNVLLPLKSKKNTIPLSLWSFSLFPLKPPTHANWQHAARQDQILNSSRHGLTHFFSILPITFPLLLLLLSFPLTLTHHHNHHLCLSLLLLSPNDAVSISLPAAAGPSSPLSPASVLPTLSRWVFYDFRESSYWTRGIFIFICLFIYLSQLKLERLLMDIVLFYFIFILI